MKTKTVLRQGEGLRMREYGFPPSRERQWGHGNDRGVAGTTEGYAGTTEGVAATTGRVAGTTEGVAGTTERFARRQKRKLFKSH
jgi:hypothetical protein